MWIDVNEKLPVNNQDFPILACRGQFVALRLYYYYDDTWYSEYGDIRIERDKPTHWQPLPLPPKTKENK